MSRYIKLDTAIEHTNQLYHGDEVEAWLESLPTIEVEDAISREYLKSFGYINKGDFNSVKTIREWIDNAPSVIPAQPNIEYILSQLADLLDEYSELDEHGLHDPKWCGVNEAYLIVKNASQKPKEGEWIPCSERLPKEHEWIGTKTFGTTISDEVYVTFESPKGERFTKHLSFQNGKVPGFKQREIDVVYKGSVPIAWMPLPEPWKGGDDEA